MSKISEQFEKQARTARTLLVLMSEYLGLIEHAERVRVLVHAMAVENGLRIPPTLNVKLVNVS